MWCRLTQANSVVKVGKSRSEIANEVESRRCGTSKKRSLLPCHVYKRRRPTRRKICLALSLSLGALCPLLFCRCSYFCSCMQSVFPRPSFGLLHSYIFSLLIHPSPLSPLHIARFLSYNCPSIRPWFKCAYRAATTHSTGTSNAMVRSFLAW
jgi:hypothetical protein